MVDIYNFINELTKFEIVFKDEKNVPYCYRSYIKSIFDDKILIAPPMYRNKAVTIDDGQKVKMVVCTETGVYTAESQVLSRELEHTPGLWLLYPYNSKHSQRREYLRAPIDTDFKLIITQNNTDKKKSRKKHQVKNISGKGLCFITDEPLGDYYDLSVEINIKDEDSKPIKTVCEHIYTKQYEVRGTTKYVHALAFIDITKHNSERIIKQCFKYQLDHRRKEKLR